MVSATKPKKTTFAWICFLFAFAMASMSMAQRAQAVEQPVGLLLALDLSGSMCPHFREVQEKVDRLLHALPEGVHLSIVTFHDRAEEIARTNYLTAIQKQTILSRLHTLQPKGQWTDFSAPVHQIALSAEQLGSPLLVVIFTDAISDPGPGKEFREIGQLLAKAFSGMKDARILLIVPREVHFQIPQQGRDVIHPTILEEFDPKKILAFVPVREISVKPKLEAPAGHQRPRTSSPQPYYYYLILGAVVAVGLGMGYLYVRDWYFAYKLRLEREPEESSESVFFNVVARCNGITYTLGLLEKIDRVIIGSAPGSDIPVPAADGEDVQAIILRKSGRLAIKNPSKNSIAVGGVELKPGQTQWLLLPAEIAFENDQRISLALVPAHDQVRTYLEGFELDEEKDGTMRQTELGSESQETADEG